MLVMERENMGKVTIKDIARLAGVSIGTVDRVLHNRGRVSDKTRDRINSIIKETGFQLDLMASRLKQKISISYGVIMPQLEQDSGYWGLCADGFAEAEKDLTPLGVSIHYFYFDRFDKDNIRQVIAQAEASSCSGYIIAPVAPPLFEEAIQSGVLGKNIILFDSDLPGIQTRAALETFAYVGLDDFGSGQLAGKLLHLLMEREQQVVVVDISENDYHLKERIRGFCQYMADLGHHQVFPVVGRDTDQLDQAKALIEPYFQGKESTLPALFVPNATTHLYVSALEALGFTGVKVVGYDVVSQNAQMVREEKIQFILSQRPNIQAFMALQNLHRGQGLRQQIPERVKIQVDIITKENLP